VDFLTEGIMKDMITKIAENSPFILLLYFLSRSIVGQAGRWFERNIDRLVNAVSSSGCMMRQNGNSYRKSDLEDFSKRLERIEEKFNRIVAKIEG
jgi:hypothetical protein